MKKYLLKSIGVILLAFIANALLSIITDFLLEKTGVLPHPDQGLFETWAILLVLFYRGLYTIAAGFLVAWLAPSKPLLHVLIIGVIGISITLLAVNSEEFAAKSELWYGYTLAAITLPCLWLGVKIQMNWKQ